MKMHAAIIMGLGAYIDQKLNTVTEPNNGVSCDICDNSAQGAPNVPYRGALQLFVPE